LKYIKKTYRLGLGLPWTISIVEDKKLWGHKYKRRQKAVLFEIYQKIILSVTYSWKFKCVFHIDQDWGSVDGRK
jgi:hypothetical protein